jgi:hypothetical protein
VDLTVGGRHRLLAAGDVKNGEPVMPERDAVGDVLAPRVGTTVELPRAHAANGTA